MVNDAAMETVVAVINNHGHVLHNHEHILHCHQVALTSQSEEILRLKGIVSDLELSLRVLRSYVKELKHGYGGENSGTEGADSGD
jgi:hypothetical protein